MRSIKLAVAAATLSVPMVALPAAPALAAPAAHEQGDASKFQRGRYRQDRYGNYNGPTWRGNDGRYRCRRSNGTTGLLIGGAAGALIGNQVAGRGDHALGTVIGGVAGALVGREVDRRESGRRDQNGRRCR